MYRGLTVEWHLETGSVEHLINDQNMEMTHAA